NNCSIEFFWRHLVGAAGPDRTQFLCGLLRCDVAWPCKYEEAAPFIKRNLRDQVRGVAKTINAEAARIACFAIGTIPDQPSAEQRRNFDIIVALWQRKTEPRIGDGEFGVAAVDRVASKTRVVAQILPARSTISAVAIRPA